MVLKQDGRVLHGEGGAEGTVSQDAGEGVKGARHPGGERWEGARQFSTSMPISSRWSMGPPTIRT